MKYPSLRVAACCVILIMSSQLSSAQAPAETAKEPAAMAALDRMGAALRGLNSFGLRADVTSEQVLVSGQKLQYGSQLTYQVRRPDGLRIDIASDRQARSIYYDGKTVTVVAPALNSYASAAAPSTIKEMLDAASAKFGIDLPLADLFTWGTDDDKRALITSAIQVSSEHIGGIMCEHYAYRQPQVDWQVWIATGAQALPCKLVITTRDDPSMPQYSAVLSWQPQQQFAADTFAYTPQPNMQRIVLGTMTPRAAGN